jgi:hypothetical protein
VQSHRRHRGGLGPFRGLAAAPAARAILTPRTSRANSAPLNMLIFKATGRSWALIVALVRLQPKEVVMKLAVTSFLSVGCLLFCLSTPSEATDAPSTALSVPHGGTMPGLCVAGQPLLSSPDKPVFLTACMVQIECDDSSVVSCSGNTSCQTTDGGHCVQCDGAGGGCCVAATCCEVCDSNYINCLNTCTDSFSCHLCDHGDTICVNHCTGGC